MFSFRPLARLSHLLLVVALLIVLPGCETPWKKPKIKKPAARDMPDQNKDMSYQAFLGRLRKAVAMRDADMLSSMMTANFGYSWEPGGEGPGVFEYWQKNNLWLRLDLVLRDKFVPSGDYMVAPAEVAYNPDYAGYRAGLRQVDGTWRFVYFVSAPPVSVKQPPVEQQPPALESGAPDAPTVHVHTTASPMQQ